MFRLKRLFFVVSILSLVPLAIQSQTTNLGENVVIYSTTGRNIGFPTDTLYLGGPFLRDTTNPFIVWLDQINTNAGWTGLLFLMYPNGTRDTLLSNHPGQNGTPTRTMIDLTARAAANGIRHMDTVVFAYQGVPGGSSELQPAYTGPNRSALDFMPDGVTRRWQRLDRYSSPQYSTHVINGYEVGRRFSVAGWLREMVNGISERSDTVQFAFEDNHTDGDWDFNDIQYKVKGLFLIKPVKFDSLILNATPYDSIIPAGDSIVYSVTLRGTDSTGKMVSFSADTVKKYVTWSLSKDYPQSTNPGLTRGTSQTATNAFFATEAYQAFTVTITATKDNVVLTAQRRIRVIPGPAHHLVIEGDTTGKPNGLVDTRPNVRDDQPIDSRTIPSSQTTTNGFAIVRDFYGNFVKFSNPALWTVYRNDNIVRVAPGRVAVGEGVFTKQGPADTAYASAFHTDSAASANALRFRDTIRVIVDNITFDTLRIVNDAGVRLTTLTIKLTQDTTLTVEAHRTDNLGWMPVQGTWALSATLNSSVAPPAGASSWNFTPTNLGTGNITVTMGALRTTLPTTVQPGGPDHISLYNKPGDPKPMLPADKYESPAIFIYPVEAGAKIDLHAKMFDFYGTWLTEYDTGSAANSAITWEVRDLTGGVAGPEIGTLSTTSGKFVSYSPTRAWDTVDVIVTFQRLQWGPFKDTVRVKINPGPFSAIWIEGDSTPNLNTAEPLNVINMNKNSTKLNVYAILRDKYQNFVQFANNASWFSDKTTAVTAAMGTHPQVGEGLITKNPVLITKDSAWVIATYQAFSDSVKVLVSDIDYTELRIVAADGPADTTALSSLTVSTNDSTTLYVKGRRSDNGLWENVTVNWELMPGMVASPAAPTQTHSWRFSPVSPDTSGNGWIRVYMPGIPTTPPDTVKPVVFSRGLPTATEFVIITPTDSLRAGDTIRAIVRIRNADGLVPGIFCYEDATYNDAAPNGTGKPVPVIVTTEANGTMRVGMEECFTDGLDTVKFVLYNADTTHKLTVVLNTLTASTDPFKLVPGDLFRLVIVDVNGNEIDSALSIHYPAGSIVMFAKGYDKWNNPFKDFVPSDWTFGGSLHQLTTRTTNISRIYYDAMTVTSSESGRIIATAVMNRQIKDSLLMNIVGPEIILKHAITRDQNADGMLDVIELVFEKPFTWPASFDFTKASNISFTHGSTTFKVASIETVGKTDSVFRVHLVVDSTIDPATNLGIPQTGWRPTVTLTGLPGVQSYGDEGVLLCEDGAPPVIRSVTKTLGATRAQDKVEVTMSEPVRSSEHNPYTATAAPNVLFTVYSWDPATKVFTAMPGMLNGINSLTETRGDTVLVFLMGANGADLTRDHYMNIQITAKMSDLDTLNVQLNPNNRRVQVRPIGQPDPKMQPIPNPSRPVPIRVAPGTMHAWNEPDAVGVGGKGWVYQDRAGVAIRITDIIKPDTSTNNNKKRSDVIKVYMKVYDIVGNMVQSAYEPDLLRAGRNINLDGSTFKLDLYWNGFNKNGMPVAPGTYRVVVYIDYDEADLKDFRSAKNVGIAR